jgi:hypothetical protein
VEQLLSHYVSPAQVPWEDGRLPDSRKEQRLVTKLRDLINEHGSLVEAEAKRQVRGVGPQPGDG